MLTTTIGCTNQVIHGCFKVPGVCYYGSGSFVTNQTNSYNVTNWINCCGTNSTSVLAPNNVLVNKVAIGVSSGGILPSNETMSINGYTGGSSDLSAFSFSQFIIFDVALTQAQMVIVSNAMNTYMTTGILQ